jgi:hypothetical protein
MMRFIGRIFWLPVTAMATSMEAASSTMRGLGQIFEGDTSASGVGRGEDRSLGLGKPGIKLVEYTIVNLQHDHEEIVDRGQTIVREPMTREAFSASLIDEFSASRGSRTKDRENLHVYFHVLDGWRSHGPTT